MIFSHADQLELNRRDREDEELAYASKEREEALMNESCTTSQLMSLTSAQYHREGRNCPWDCAACPGNQEPDDVLLDALRRETVELTIPSLNVEVWVSPEAAKATAIELARQYGKAVKVARH